MIYLFEFFKGASLALMLFGALFLFFKFNSFFYLCIGVTPGLLLALIFTLILENHELKNKLKQN
ncbi:MULTISPECIES: hypothetical protein [unclassified Campylobacter]|uniref:hypothetical protein n=1 Tax=unclassified Campylobacter TaxID=2593542 RepID=UPI001237D1B3|nr:MULTISPECIES: hypothetical protein [unclassified Campylobacter]KAA6228442.1 hypothetical protein FMM54_00870 [Campylobacter sp. LR185c]KAA6228929.1 hypothetical protein FMM55_00415 [Campylobacter sp. LR196d]KAA6229414.1 hypothetical protein FMM57_00875 [Campylobacter sp. LR286c]KAA6229880.1 hypothetical protein FMM56_07555 [Campylobacter sp. LR264d]KAA8603707.1 hypothetical protein CGP82_05860 [Campylobacter sp. LR185c]